MRHRRKGRRLGVSAPHRRAMLANLACSLIEHGGINTTEARAKELRSYIEKLITFAKRGDVHARRVVFARLRNRRAVKKLFDEWAPHFASLPTESGEREWNGGYVRILKLGRRKGDSAPISMIEFIVPEEREASAQPTREQEGTTEPADEGSETANEASSSEANS